jgi:hypothetical protein
MKGGGNVFEINTATERYLSADWVVCGGWGVV